MSPTVNRETRIVGSINAEIMASLLLPIPPNVLAVSKAASIIKNLPRARMETNMIKSPGNCFGTMIVETGTSIAAARAVEKNR